jgi:D-beta-D-heptose 7-phosphate kinase / D-beta-D-heptose 1-phosphate adenosyltransferase
LLNRVERWIARCGCVAVSDYSKGVLTDRLLAKLMLLCAEAKRPVIVDPKRAAFDAYRGAAFIKPNSRELTQATNIESASDEGAELAAGEVISRYGIDVLLTRSERGMSLFRHGNPPVHARTTAREVFDVSGAGDTALAVFSTHLARGDDPVEAMHYANTAAGIVITKLGTAVVTASELKAVKSSEILAGITDRIVTAERAITIARLWKDLGLQVGFTNGCFDLLHSGHVSLFKKISSACDRLVVGVNTDASVRRIKGPPRPVQDQTSRAQVIASLQGVDLVVLFDEDTPNGLIRSLRPDVLAKGADYREDQVIGADLVKSYGGRVLLVDLVDNVSTTKTINRINIANAQ